MRMDNWTCPCECVGYVHVRMGNYWVSVCRCRHLLAKEFKLQRITNICSVRRSSYQSLTLYSLRYWLIISSVDATFGMTIQVVCPILRLLLCLFSITIKWKLANKNISTGGDSNKRKDWSYEQRKGKYPECWTKLRVSAKYKLPHREWPFKPTELKISGFFISSNSSAWLFQSIHFYSVKQSHNNCFSHML